MELAMSDGQTLNPIDLGRVDEYLDTEPDVENICKISKASKTANVEQLSPFILMRKVPAAVT